jgi:hypothetical protein
MAAFYGKVEKRSERSEAVAASPRKGRTPKISSRVRKVEL